MEVRHQAVGQRGDPLPRGEEGEDELRAEGRQRLAVGRVGLVGREQRERFLEGFESSRGALCQERGVERLLDQDAGAHFEALELGRREGCGERRGRVGAAEGLWWGGGAGGAGAGEEVAGEEVGTTGGGRVGDVDVGDSELGVLRDGAEGAHGEGGAREGDAGVGRAGVVEERGGGREGQAEGGVGRGDEGEGVDEDLWMEGRGVC